MKKLTTPIDGSIHSRLDEIQEHIEVLTRGLTLMVETQDAHSKMLLKILEACTVEPEKSELAEVLESLCEAVENQTQTLADVGETLDQLGPSIELAVVRGVHRAVGTTDEDGVLQ